MIATKEDLILHLATILIEERAEQNKIANALHYIGSNFGFDCGIIYESDQQNKFHQKESFSEIALCFPQSFYLEDLSEKMIELISSSSLLYLNKSNTNSATEQTLLSYFACHSMLLSSLRTENNALQGIFIFISVTPNSLLANDDLSTLKSLLLLLEQSLSARLYHNTLTFAKTSLECILDHTGIDIYVNDFYTHEVLYVNESMAAPYGGASSFLNKKCWQVLFPGNKGQCDFCPQKNLIDEYGSPTKVYTWDYQRPFDGSWFRVFSSAFRWTDGRLAHMVCSADITDNKKKEELIAYMANYDELTNLPNRRKLVIDCDAHINNASTTEQGYVLFFDIDDFKKVNDNYGHDAGDELLIQISSFFLEIPLLKNTIYRNGGDEFVAIIGGEYISPENIKNLIGFIHERFQKPWILKAGTIFCNTSVGVSCYPQDGNTADVLLSIADQAMYAAKKEGAGKMHFGYELKNND